MFSFSVFPLFLEVATEDGPMVAERFCLSATDGHGRRWLHFHVFSSADDAFEFEHKVAESGRCNPPESEHWVETDPVYGSAAYEARGGDLATDRVAFLAATGDHHAAEQEARLIDGLL